MIRPAPLARFAVFLAACAMAATTARAQVSVDFPLRAGVIPSYDRVDGVSLPFGPTITVGEERVVVNPLITYRSHLGKIDPSLSIGGQITRDSTLGFVLSGARGTFTNDGWIRSNLVNSLVTLGLGHDSRNYFRADRGEARLTSALRVPLDVATIFVGGRTERDWSTGWRGGETMGPYSMFGRNDVVDGIQRPNPEINAGHINSVIAGGRAEYVGLPGSASLDVLFEAAGRSGVGGSFQQLTVNQRSSLETVANQRVEILGHLVTTATNTLTPWQRYAYVGGSGSLATVDLMSLGGDHLYFLDVAYVIPIPGMEIPFLGNPYLAPHFATGAAAVGGFGRPGQNIGVRLGVSVFTLDYLVNPRTHKQDIGVGISLRP
jgi:hypothetical protein